MRPFCCFCLGGLVGLCLAASVAGQARAAANQVEEPTDLGGLELRDVRGAIRRLEDGRDRRVLVVVFLGVECPLLDRRRVVRYQGRIDDQYRVGVRREAPARRDLAEALQEIVSGREVTAPGTSAAGCFISRAARHAASGEVTYYRDITPIFQQHCQNCHRQGQVAPFALTTYDDAVAWAETIAEVVEQRRMPPWHADPRYGRFANDPSLSEEQRRKILRWMECGTPAGEPNDAPQPAAAIEFTDGWATWCAKRSPRGC